MRRRQRSRLRIFTKGVRGRCTAKDQAGDIARESDRKRGKRKRNRKNKKRGGEKEKELLGLQYGPASYLIETGCRKKGGRKKKGRPIEASPPQPQNNKNPAPPNPPKQSPQNPPKQKKNQKNKKNVKTPPRAATPAYPPTPKSRQKRSNPQKGGGKKKSRSYGQGAKGQSTPEKRLWLKS